MNRLLALTLLLAAAVSSPAQTRLASDFEIAEMRKQIERTSDFLSQLSARLNLGDLHLARNEISIARAEYERALSLAEEQRIESRRESNLTAYATASAYAGLALAKLGRSRDAFAALEESVRYTSDSPKTWNLYATAMAILDRPARSVSAARNAVSLAAGASPLDVAVYRYALAAALIENDETEEAEVLLRNLIASLRSPEFEAIRRQIARSESFEIYSTARGEAAAYLSLLNRAQLRLAGSMEKRGEHAEAVALYRAVLQQRTDDVHALAALARLTTAEEQARWFDAAFDANPFSLPLIRAYQQHLRSAAQPEVVIGESAGDRIRRALLDAGEGRTLAARTALEVLGEKFPENATLQILLRDLDGAPVPEFLAARPETAEPSRDELTQLISAIAAGTLSPDDRLALDAIRFRGAASFDSAVTNTAGQTVLESGTIDGVPFRFAQPTAFTGSFAANAPLRLTYRILGVTDAEGADAILAEPLGIEVIQ